MVNDMFFLTKNLSKRTAYSIALIGLGDVLWLCAAVVAAVGMLPAALSFLLLKAADAVWLVFYLYKPYRRQTQNDLLVVENTSGMAAPPSQYDWSDSNRQIVEHYQSLLNWKEVMELSVQSARFMALQRQINPHFLYNTLDSIRSDMIIAGNDQIAATVEALSQYFSYATYSMEQMATVLEELNNVQDYFVIQKYRFEDRLHLEIINEVGESEINDIRVPRMTIQPIIENSIIHGLETCQEDGLITLHLVRSENALIIHVIDNGVGIDAAELSRLNERLACSDKQNQEEQGGGIALDNVNRRIKLLYGDEYGLHIFSFPGVGTDVSVRLPCA